MFCFLDTETTGVSFLSSDVIQVSFSLATIDQVLTDSPYDTFSTNVNLPKEYVWDPYAEAVHGITEDAAKIHGSNALEALSDARSFIHKHIGEEQKAIVVGSTAYFDYVHMLHLAHKAGASALPFQFKVFDVTQAGRTLGLGSDLSTVTKGLGIALDKSRQHNASYDAFLHREVFKNLLTFADKT